MVRKLRPLGVEWTALSHASGGQRGRCFGLFPSVARFGGSVAASTTDAENSHTRETVPQLLGRLGVTVRMDVNLCGGRTQQLGARTRQPLRNLESIVENAVDTRGGA
jgi:hypothetical protein